ncbi:MAG: tRNA pseudouridine(38-40) synthase TruA [Lachnospiraceae bacterium]|nr:tRNA pseudouridine(38-40) synthase TruA [Lachnospiraceae bacterium]
MRRIMLTVAYDGTDFHGWQVQPGVRTVEGELNTCLSELLGAEVQVIGASRTDAGVHALGNLAVFDTESYIPAEKFAYALNCKLPSDVKVQKSEEVAADFHPRKCDSVKTYEYHIDSGEFPMPINSRYAYYTYHTPDVELMREAAKYIVGEHDFKSFCSVHTQAETTVRTVYAVDVEQTGREIVIRVSGSGFLYNMVRIIAGTLLEAGMGKYEPSKVAWMFEQCDRTVAGPTLPPEGLRLCRIEIKE